MVVLHGGSGSWTHWLRMLGPLTQAGHAVWALDLPGFEVLAQRSHGAATLHMLRAPGAVAEGQ